MSQIKQLPTKEERNLQPQGCRYNRHEQGDSEQLHE